MSGFRLSRPALSRRARDGAAAQTAETRSKPPRLVLRFAVTTAVGLAVAAASILIFVRHHATAQAEDAVAVHGRFVADSILSRELRPSDFVAPVGPVRRTTLDRLFRTRVLTGGVLQVRLLDRDGRITYSSNPALIGRVAPDAPKVRDALRKSMLTDVAAVKGRDGERAKALAVYVPVRFAASRHVGVFELSQDYAPIARAARKAFVPVAGVLQLVLIALYISLFPLLRRVTRRLRRQMREIEHRALHDALTGLPNRVLFRQRVEQALVEARRAGCRVGLALIDLDRFKEVNDTLGHQSGDQLLQELGVRLQGMVRSGETVARLGGDEFGVVSPFASDARSARALAERVRHGIERPLVMDDLTLTVEASVGIALFPDHGADVDTLMRHADVAMYVSKTAHATKIYAPEHDQYSYDRLAIVGELRRALANEELVLHYQPRVALASGELQGVEALVRWNHPGRGLLLPSEFIPAAEHTGLIRPITHYVLDAALRQCRAWRDEGREVPVAVNLSPRDLLDVGLPDEVCALLDKWGVEPDSLELEITERTVVTDPPRVQAVLSTLRERRIGLSLDDFGTGYSSLRHLRQLPVDIVKIDQSFVGQITTDRNDEIVVRSTIDLGHNLGLEVVAEGVADEETWSRLVALGCDTAQGFYISRPLTAGALTRWLANRGYEAASTAERRERDGEAAVVALARRRGNAYKQDSLVPAGHRPLAHLSGRR